MPVTKRQEQLTPYWQSPCGRAVVYVGDCREVMAKMKPDTFHAVVTDPPYDLTGVSRNGSPRNNDPEKPFGRHNLQPTGGFMGQKWDGTGVAFDSVTWERVMHVAKPGAHLLSFGGTRTYHRMICAIEDAGFEVRDCIMWVYGSGFPKSHDVSKAIDKMTGAERDVISREQNWGARPEIGPNGHVGEWDITVPTTDAAKQWDGWESALKPAYEPILVARKPLIGSVAQNVLDHGCGGINVDGCRVGTEVVSLKGLNNNRNLNDDNWKGIGGEVPPTTSTGRWPANLIHDGSEEVVGLFPAQDSGTAARFFKTCHITEEDLKWSQNEIAKDVENCFALQSEYVVSVLTHAVERSTQRLVLQSQSVQVQSMNVSGTQLRLVCESVIETIQSLERRYSLGLLLERSTVQLGPVTCVAIPSQTGTILITISLTTSAHCVEVVTFIITSNSLEHGGQDSAKKRSRAYYTSKAGGDRDRPHGKRGNAVHPTVKPLDLMRYLVRLVCAKGGTVLDPFMGSGSTGCAAIEEGMRFVGIEQDEKYADIAVGRLRLSLEKAPPLEELKTGRVVRQDTPPPPKKLRG